MRGFLILVLIVAAVGGALYFYGGSFKLPPREKPPATTETPATDQPAAPAAPANPYLLDLIPTQARAPINGGSAVVLFTDTPEARDANTVTCLNVWDALDAANGKDLQLGQRKGADGTVETARPLYWMDAAPLAAGEHGCDERMAKYDYARAATIRAKYGLTNAGPYLLVTRADEKAAATVDLTGMGDREIADMVRYFRDGFAYQPDILDPARATSRGAAAAAFFGARFQDSLGEALGFVANPAPRAGCALGDLADAPCT